MDVDLLTLPLKILIGIVLWTLVLLTYRVFHAVIDDYKTSLPPSVSNREDVASECVHRTGEYFLKSTEPCTCTGVISGVVTHISNSDKFRLFHSDPGYSQLEDALHVKLTGLKVSQNRGTNGCKIGNMQTNVRIDDACSAKTTNCNGRKVHTYNCIQENPRSVSNFDERQLWFDASNIKETHSSQDIKIQTPQHTKASPGISMDDPFSICSQPSTISGRELPIEQGKDLISRPLYGQLKKGHNRSHLANGRSDSIQFEQELAKVFNQATCTTRQGNGPSDVERFPSYDHRYPLLNKILCGPLHTNDILQENAVFLANDMQEENPGTPKSAIELPEGELSAQHTISPEPKHDPLDLIDMGMANVEISAEGRISDDRNLENYQTNGSELRLASQSGVDNHQGMSSMPPTVTSGGHRSPTSGNDLEPDEKYALEIRSKKKLLHSEMLRKIATSTKGFDPMKVPIEVDSTRETDSYKLGTFLVQQNSLNSSNSFPKIESGLSRRDELPETSAGSVQLDKNPPCSLIDVSQEIATPECLQMKTPDEESCRSAFLEVPIDFHGSSNQHEDTWSKQLLREMGDGHTNTSNMGTYNTTSDYEEVHWNAEASLPDVTCASSDVQDGGNTCEGDITSITKADEGDLMCVDELPDSDASGKHQKDSFGPETVNRSKEIHFSQDGIDTLTPLKADESNSEVLRRVINSRRRSSSSNSSCSVYTTSGDSFIFSRPPSCQNRLG